MASGVLLPDGVGRRGAADSRSAWRGWVYGAVAVAALAAAWRYAEVNPAVLFDRATLASLRQFVAALVPPDLSLDFLKTVGRAALLTLATAIASTTLSVVLAVPLGMLGCASLWRTGIVATSRGEGPGYRLLAAASVAVRGLLGFLRAVPDLVWALLFVAALGLGPLAGTLALAVSYTGVLGRVYADVFDAVDSQPVEALLSTGAGRVQLFIVAIWPQALPNLTAYTLYSFECCVRAAAVLGFVGAGGIGYEISVSMRLFDYGQVSTLLAAFIVILSVTDFVSRRLRGLLRGEMQRRRGSGAKDFGVMAAVPSPEMAEIAAGAGDVAEMGSEFAGRPAAEVGGGSGWRSRLVVAAIALAVAASFYLSGFLGLFTGMVTDGAMETPLELLRFLMRLLRPDLSLHFLASLWLPLVQTLAITLLGTLVGVLLGAPLSLLATSRLVLPQGEDRHGLLSQAARYGMYWGSRTVLSVLRSIPELVWALICIIAIGIGPFAGTIALGLHTAGVLGKLYADTMEEVRLQPVEALRALGARPLQLLLWAIWPQTRQLLGSYTVLRWDMNLRAATILGLVGGGGLGQVMYNDVQLGFYPRVATLILFVYALVMATDWVGTRIWTRLPE